MFTEQELQITAQAFSTPINPLDPNAEAYGRSLKSILQKMSMMVVQQPVQFGPGSIAASSEQAEGNGEADVTAYK
ncbi:MAG: hypothetical protein ABL984_16040 [Pyrinomonadaceae bacterium]